MYVFPDEIELITSQSREIDVRLDGFREGGVQTTKCASSYVQLKRIHDG